MDITRICPVCGLTIWVGSVHKQRAFWVEQPSCCRSCDSLAPQNNEPLVPISLANLAILRSCGSRPVAR